MANTAFPTAVRCRSVTVECSRERATRSPNIRVFGVLILFLMVIACGDSTIGVAMAQPEQLSAEEFERDIDALNRANSMVSAAKWTVACRVGHWERPLSASVLGDSETAEIMRAAIVHFQEKLESVEREAESSVYGVVIDTQIPAPESWLRRLQDEEEGPPELNYGKPESELVTTATSSRFILDVGRRVRVGKKAIEDYLFSQKEEGDVESEEVTIVTTGTMRSVKEIKQQDESDSGLSKLWAAEPVRTRVTFLVIHLPSNGNGEFSRVSAADPIDFVFDGRKWKLLGK